jgi:hypothetical protein
MRSTLLLILLAGCLAHICPNQPTIHVVDGVTRDDGDILRVKFLPININSYIHTKLLRRATDLINKMICVRERVTDMYNSLELSECAGLTIPDY